MSQKFKDSEICQRNGRILNFFLDEIVTEMFLLIRLNVGDSAFPTFTSTALTLLQGMWVKRLSLVGWVGGKGGASQTSPIHTHPP